jgi:hypothetical protein
MLFPASIPARVGVVLVDVDFAVVLTIPSLTLPNAAEPQPNRVSKNGVLPSN